MSISTDPEYNLAAPSVTDPQYPSYLDATNIVNAIAAWTDSDLTNGALYYANLKESTSGWFFRHIVNDPANHPLRATLGHQVFLRLSGCAQANTIVIHRFVLGLVSHRIGSHERRDRDVSPGSDYRTPRGPDPLV